MWHKPELAPEARIIVYVFESSNLSQIRIQMRRISGILVYLVEFMRQKSLVTFRKTKWNRFSNIMGTFSPGNSTCTTAENKGVLPRKTLSRSSQAYLTTRQEFSIQLDTSWPSKIIRIISQDFSNVIPHR